MFFAGIDIAKNKHEISIIDQNGQMIGKSFSLANSHTGANKIIEFLNKHQIPFNDIVFGLEATGHYWLSMYSFLKAKGFPVFVVNPIQSDAFRNVYIRQVKTDVKDSFIIADLIRFGRHTETSLAKEDVLALRQLTRYRMFLVDTISDLKRKAIAVLDQLFPEYASLFSDTFGKTSMELLKLYPTPDDIAAADIDKLFECIHKASKGRLGFEKAEQLQQMAHNTFGISLASDAFAFQLKLFLEQIEFSQKQLALLDKQIEDRLAAFHSTITTITGIGPVLGAIILAEIGDISRFSDPSKLVAFVGIDPSVKQSGEFKGVHNKMSKRGSPYLRRAIWMAATVAAFHDPALKEFYEKKRSQGKHHLTAIGAVARKLTYIIFAVLRDNSVYSPNHQALSTNC